MDRIIYKLQNNPRGNNNNFPISNEYTYVYGFFIYFI